MITTTSALQRATFLLTLCAVSHVTAAGPVTFRAVTYMNRYDQPIGLIEGSPGVLYFVSGTKPQVAALSVSTQGSKITLAAFPYFVQSILVGGANGRF
jgi:hypothetical protein